VHCCSSPICWKRRLLVMASVSIFWDLMLRFKWVGGGGNHFNASREMIDIGAFPRNVYKCASDRCSLMQWSMPENTKPAESSGSPAAGRCVPPQAPTLNLVYKCPSPPPLPPLPLPPSPALALAHTLWYALKFNQMLNYILTSVPTSWLYSPVSD